ncbi:MAG: hypothetical protein LIP16_00750 [Clostridium sp.]|nr:hypothetical protein [Clostridium sp.]
MEVRAERRKSRKKSGRLRGTFDWRKAALLLLSCGNIRQTESMEAEFTAQAAPSQQSEPALPNDTAGKRNNAEQKGEEMGARTFNFNTKTVTLNNGYEIPIFGLGTYSLRDEVGLSTLCP